MTANRLECERILAEMSSREQVLFLARIGYWLSIVDWRLHAPNIDAAEALRAVSHVQVRIYPQIASLMEGKELRFDIATMASWLSGDQATLELQAGFSWALHAAIKQSHGT
jgi:hypothetical protein